MVYFTALLIAHGKISGYISGENVEQNGREFEVLSKHN
jgi:hypothetical protein